MKIKILFIVLVANLLFGCAGAMPAEENVQKVFTYDFQLPGKSKSEIWTKARNHFSTTYGDFRSVFSVQDENEGTLIGKGLQEWHLVGNTCLSEYHVRFISKDNKARLQYEIINGVPALSKCGWPFPSQGGYDEVVESFESSMRSLKNALEGQGVMDKLSDF